MPLKDTENPLSIAVRWTRPVLLRVRCPVVGQGCTENLADSWPWGSGLGWRNPGRLRHDL